MLAPDELADIFLKGRQTQTSNSSLHTELLKLFEKNRTSRRIISRSNKAPQAVTITLVDTAHIAVFGGITTENFEHVWQAAGGGRTGLASRFSLSFSGQCMPRLKTPTNDDALQQAAIGLHNVLNLREGLEEVGELASSGPRNVHLLPEAQEVLADWRVFDDEVLARHPRVLDMAKRFALILAATTGLDAVDGDTMQHALAFADYQIAIKDRLLAPDASSFVEAFEHKILRFYEKQEAALSRELCISKIRPDRCAGGFTAFNQAWRALEAAGQLIVAGKTRKGKPAYSIARG